MVTIVAALLLNDAALAEGGTPRLMSGQGTVRMAREKVVLKVGANKTNADCTFRFENDGAQCSVKMGFPDNGYGAADPEEEVDPNDRDKPPKTGPMESFRSWVNGIEVKTLLERGKDAGEYWHTKTVTFKAHGTTIVRDKYSLSDSSAIVMFKEKSGNAHYAGYVVHTGASWKGKIGRSEIIFEMPFAVKSIISRKTVTSRDRREFTVAGLPKGAVVYSGMTKPAISGRTLRFVRTNWRPTLKDDIELWYDFTSIK